MKGVTMLLSLIMLGCTQATTADRVLERFKNAHEVPVVAEIAYTYEARGQRPAELKVLLDGRKRTIMRAVHPEGSYSLSVTPTRGQVEIESSSKFYDIVEYAGHIVIPMSRISSLSQAFPTFELVEDLRGLAASDSKFELRKPIKVNGFEADVLATTYRDLHGAEVEATIAVDRNGTVVQYSYAPKGTTNLIQKWTLRSYRKRDSIDEAEFIEEIPVGYTPHTLRVRRPRVYAGAKFPLEGWQGRRGAVSLKDLAKGKRLFVAIVDAEEPSVRAMASIQRLQKAIATVVIEASGSVPQATIIGGAKLQSEVAPPATPYFALLEPDGTVVKLWMGFDPEGAPAFERDVLNPVIEE